MFTNFVRSSVQHRLHLGGSMRGAGSVHPEPRVGDGHALLQAPRAQEVHHHGAGAAGHRALLYRSVTVLKISAIAYVKSQVDRFL